MKAKPVIITLLLAIVAYVGFWAYRQYSLLKQTSIKLISYRLGGLLTKQASLQVVIRITNNSDMDLQAKGGNFNLYLNNVFISNVPVKITQILYAGKTLDIPLTAYFNPAAVIKQGVQVLLKDKNNIYLTIDGKVSVITQYIAINNIKINEKIRLSDILN